MRVPEVLTSLTHQGVIDEVLRPLKSGKEAQVYLVLVDDEPRVAKVYKDAAHRSFKQRAEYTEGRRVRNTRDQRAIDRKTRHGRAQEEEAWKSAEVNFIYRLHEAGVRVPTPYNFIDGVLIMELVRDHDGQPAPRLGELHLDATTARIYFDQLLREVIRMLCAGVVHGDLSDFNVLVDARGPVVIDFPQSVDAAQNRNARKLLIRDVDNLGAFLARCVPGTRRRPYGEEIWRAYENNELTPEYELKGSFRRSDHKADVGDVLDVIADADFDEQMRRERLGQPGPRPRKREVIITPAQAPRDRNAGGRGRGGGGRGQSAGGQGSGGRGSGGQGSGGQRAGGQRGGQRRGGQGAGGQRGGGQSSGGQSSGGQSSGGQRPGSQDGARRDERPRAEGQPLRTDDQRNESPRADGEAPRRRRRRRKPPASANGNGTAQAAREPRAPRPPSGQGSAETPPRDPAQAAGAGGASKRRRRRRGRRGKGAGAPPEPIGP